VLGEFIMPNEEFDQIMQFFSLNSEEKESQLSEVFEAAVAYFERFKYIMLNGSKEEQDQAVKEMMSLKNRVEEETQNICDKTGLTPEQLATYSNDPKNFSEEHWNAISNAKNKLNAGLEEAKESIIKTHKKEEKKGEVGRKPLKKRHPRNPKNWTSV